MRAWEQLPMPHFAHGARIGPEMGLKGRHIALALAGGVLAAAAVSYAATLYLGYTEGDAQPGKRRRMVHPYNI